MVTNSKTNSGLIYMVNGWPFQGRVEHGNSMHFSILLLLHSVYFRDEIIQIIIFWMLHPDLFHHKKCLMVTDIFKIVLITYKASPTAYRMSLPSPTLTLLIIIIMCL